MYCSPKGLAWLVFQGQAEGVPGDSSGGAAVHCPGCPGLPADSQPSGRAQVSILLYKHHLPQLPSAISCMHCAWFSVQCALCSVVCTACTLYCTLRSLAHVTDTLRNKKEVTVVVRGSRSTAAIFEKKKN